MKNNPLVVALSKKSFPKKVSPLIVGVVVIDISMKIQTGLLIRVAVSTWPSAAVAKLLGKAGRNVA